MGDTVTNVALSDPNVGDIFYIQVLTDVHFGTPIFLTVGGKSMCPGEPGTNMREDQVSITRIVPRCGSSGTDDCRNLPYGSLAEFAIVIDNFSPYDDSRMIEFFIQSRYAFDQTNQACGDAGRVGGLVIMSRGSVLGGRSFEMEYLPVGESEVVITADSSSNCLEYNDVELELISECEWAMRTNLCLLDVPTLEDNKDGVNVATQTCRILPLGRDREAKFSVSWEPSKPSTRRLQDEAVGHLPVSDDPALENFARSIISRQDNKLRIVSRDQAAIQIAQDDIQNSIKSLRDEMRLHMTNQNQTEITTTVIQFAIVGAALCKLIYDVFAVKNGKQTF